MAGRMNSWEPARRRIGGSSGGVARHTAEAEAAAWRLQAADVILLANSEVTNEGYISQSIQFVISFYTPRSPIVDGWGEMRG
jgi:hypothetical protein